MVPALILLAAQQPVFRADRTDLAERLIRFERAWAETGDTEVKRKAVPLFSQAVVGFLGGDPGGSCRAIDRAVAVLQGLDPDPMDAVSLRVAPGVLNPGEPLRWELRWSYDPGPLEPIDVRVGDDTHTLARGAVLRGLIPSPEDTTLLTVDAGGRTWSVEVPVVPGVEGLAKRAAASEHPEAKGFAELYAKRDTAEVQPDWPALADRVERLLRDPASPPGPDVALARWGSTWLRAWLPPRAPGTLVVAVHGAGGSENLFFDGYGGGRASTLAAQRGWAFVAPRAGAGAGAVQDAIGYYGNVFGEAPGRVVLMGHSMGGAVVLNAVRAGVKPAALVLFAPAAAAWPAEAKEVPAFLAVGAQELAMLARSATSLRQARPDATFLQPDPCEHYLVVGEAADAAYRWLDETLKPGG